MTNSRTGPAGLDRRRILNRREFRDIHALMVFGKHIHRLWPMALLAMGVAAAQTAAALPPSPSVKPAYERQSRIVSAAELTLLDTILRDADAGRWDLVRRNASGLTDASARALVRWRQTRSDTSGMSVRERQQTTQSLPTWPDQYEILESIERTLTSSDLTANERIAWLTANPPRTGEGVLALADAHHSMGQTDEMAKVIRAAWQQDILPDDVRRRIQTDYASYLGPDDYWQRVDMLLWRGRISDAQDLLSRLTTGRRKLAEARIAVRRNQSGVDNYVQAVPAEYSNDPGLMYERARWRERRGRDQGQLEMLLGLDGTQAPPIGRMAIWTEKHAEIRMLLREGKAQAAYQLTLNHGMDDGEGFRDAEWTAGWIALTRLNDPVAAEAHFRIFGDGVSTPISVARARYWLGRALEKQGRKTEAESAFLEAATYNYVFYGQLAAEKIENIRPQAVLLSFPVAPLPSDADRTAFRNRLDVKAALLLAELGRLWEFEEFSNAIDDVLSTEVEHKLLYDIGSEALHMRAAVRGAKAGLGRGVVSAEAVFPVFPLPRSTRNGAAEDAMVLALSRQESEFYPGAISSANARGLMQMIPRYARAEARSVGVSFRESWLTDDPLYSLRLGRGFLDELVDQFDGSYILAAAAYNAGPTRARQWIRELGDPRAPGVDPVDWIEMIPFSETRNYVQRVLENTQVYRSRLRGEPTRLRLSADLKRGG